LNFGLSLDFSVQLKVSLSELLIAERKAKSKVKVTHCKALMCTLVDVS